MTFGINLFKKIVLFFIKYATFLPNLNWTYKKVPQLLGSTSDLYIVVGNKLTVWNWRKLMDLMSELIDVCGHCSCAFILRTLWIAQKKPLQINKKHPTLFINDLDIFFSFFYWTRSVTPDCFFCFCFWKWSYRYVLIYTSKQKHLTVAFCTRSEHYKSVLSL